MGFAFANGLMTNALNKAQFDDDTTQNVGPSDYSLSISTAGYALCQRKFGSHQQDWNKHWLKADTN
jgi:hypothetical protein